MPSPARQQWRRRVSFCEFDGPHVKQALKVEYLPIDKLVPYARNARTHGDAQVAQIAGSIREFGWSNPILIDGSGGIIAGHGRVLAARQLGMDTVPCIRLGHLSDTQRRALVIADNKLALNAGWDDELLALELEELQTDGFDLELTGFSGDELADLMALGGDGAAGAFAAGSETGSGAGSLAARFGVPPFSVLNAREGWWQDRKQAWIGLGIQSELGRGTGATWGDTPEVTEPGLNHYRNRRKANAVPGEAPMPLDRAKANATPGGSAMPAANYSKNHSRGDGRGRAAR